MLGDPRMLLVVIPDDVKRMWNEQALRGLILVSLALQIILTLLGHIRKYNPRTLVRNILWCVYFLAYAVVPVALSFTIQHSVQVSNTSHCTSKSHESNTMEIMSFWASFLFLHLGGPDTITTYSLEDSGLWLRQLVLIVFQSGVALYIFLLSWPGCSHLPLLSIFIYASGFIKCFGRVRALRLANTEHLRTSMLGPADPGPDYPKILEEFRLKKKQGFIVTFEEVPESPHPLIHSYSESQCKSILEAYDLFQKFERLFVDLILTYEDRDNSTSYFEHLDSGDKAFSAVEIELGFAYDKLYTKATAVYTDKGLILRATCVFLILLVLVGFCLLIDMHIYNFIDVAITYALIAAEISKEILGVIIMLRSDWTDIWLNQHNRTRDTLIFAFLKEPNKQRSSISIAQSELLSVALHEKPASFLKIQKWVGLDEYCKRQRYETYSQVSANLKDMMYRQFRTLMVSDRRPLCFQGGSYSLHKNTCHTDLTWSINGMEFDRSILIWHIATSLCYYSEVGDQLGINRIESNHISKYLANLLVSNPEMLPRGIGMIRYRDTCAEAEYFFKTKGPITDKAHACRKLLQVDCNELLPNTVKGDRSKSVLFDGVRLASGLKEMESERMWKVISQVWIEMLGYCAARCGGFHHSQQLGGGGQLLTHVWFLMAHLGLTDHFQVSRGHARARFDVS